MIITFASQKGGAGKSTLSIHLAHAIATNNRRVLVVDADPQGSAQNWAAARDDKPPFPVIGIARDSLHRDLPELAANYDHVVIDSPPRVSALARSAILAADLVLIPVQPSSYDIWAAAETVDLVKEAQQFKADLVAAFVINRAIPKTIIARDVEEAIGDYPFPLLPITIAQRVAFSEASAGYTVLESEPSGAAAREVKQFSKAVLKFMGVDQW
jgi:chromosome partitioning protein